MRLADEPGGKLVAPGRFLPAAERYGLIREIDRMVLAKVTALLGGQHGARGRADRDQLFVAVDHRRRDARADRARLALATASTRRSW